MYVVKKVTTLMDQRMVFTYLPCIPGRTNTVWCRRYHAPPNETNSRRVEQGKLLSRERLLQDSGQVVGTVNSKCDNIAKVPNVPTLVFPQPPPEDGGGRATLSHGKEDYGKEDYGPTAYKALVDDRS